MTPPDSAAELATWESPDHRRVVYPLPLLHEIDMTVNEGFRRIPHGGIEVGGLLFGRAREDEMRLAAFRPIDCEHDFGPSFKLSERDLAGVEEQIRKAGTDTELAPLQPIGWFVAHTRSELKAGDAEAELFDRLFPGPGRLALLVKPEKFKPTRFAFLLRDATGEMQRDGTPDPFILPLPSRARAPRTEKLEQPVPVQRAATPEVRVAPEPVQPVPEEPVAPARIPVQQQPPPEPAKPEFSEAEEDWPFRPRNIRNPAQSHSQPEPAAEVVHRERGASKSTFRGIVILAGVLGCGLGYWAYLQLPPGVIDVQAEASAGKLLIWWPAGETRNADRVAVRIDDGEPVPLAAAVRDSGRLTVAIPADDSGSVKVELVAHRSLRDSRGIVRFLLPVMPR